MANKKTVTRPASRSSITGQFVTEQYARRHPNTTENERIKKRR